MKAISKISDFGQKIGGARKDISRMYMDRMAAVTNDALILKSLSKVYQLPDLSALWRAGEITEDQAARAWYVWTLIEKKPQRKGVTAWANNTYILLQALTDVLTGECEGLPGSVVRLFGREKYDYFRMEVKAAGWPEKEYKRGVYRVGKRLYNSLSSKPYTVTSGRYYKGDYATMSEAVDRIRELVATEKNNETDFEVRRWTQTDERFICPCGKSGIVLRRGIENSNEARRIITEEAAELKAEYNNLRTFPDERRDWNRPRLGDNFRAGLDISPETFGALVPFRGVEFGNWVNQLERAACLNECADALWDLANITGLRLDVLAQNGTLAMAFGARGATKARAHYEPMKRVINITKRTGAGCLAHEWWHSLDNYIMIREGQSLMYAVGDCRCIKDATTQQAANILKIAINRSDYARRSEKIDEYKSKKYWGTIVELSARAFEAFVYYKMEAAGMQNDYLVNFKTSDEYERSDCYPYPTREEAETFAPLFESFFNAVFSTEERSVPVSSFVSATLSEATAIVAIQEAEVITEVSAEVMIEPAAEIMPTIQEEVPEEAPANEQPEAVQVEEIPTYGESEKSPFFPETLADHRKYFAAVETFCNSFNLIYHFDLLNEKKVRLFVMFLNGEKVLFDYEVTSRHRDAFAFRESDEKRRRIKNWSVAIETMKHLLNQPSGTSPEGTESGAAPGAEIVAYGDAEKSLPMLIAASESTASSDRRPAIENITLQMVAGGILGDKESTNVAKRIIAEGLEEQFNQFRTKDKYANGSLMDLFDTVVNFPIHNSEIKLYGDSVELKYLHFSGMKPEESLRKLFDYANGKDYELMDECEFKLRGVKGFLPYNSYLFHQCFAEGRITVDELIKMLQEQED